MNVSEESDELLSVAKNTSTIAFQILRDAQDDNMIGEVHFDTPSFLFITHPPPPPNDIFFIKNVNFLHKYTTQSKTLSYFCALNLRKDKE